MPTALYLFRREREAASGIPAPGEAAGCVDRLARILAKEFDIEELMFVQNLDFDAIRIEAFESARSKKG